MNLTILCGGVGAARLLSGFQLLVEYDPSINITAIVNTGDDDRFYGYHVSPDIDSILYHLSDLHDEVRGWGRKNETFNFVESLKELGQDAWFNLGDKDIALNHVRTSMLNSGSTLTETTDFLAKTLGIASMKIVPMTDLEAKTTIATDELGTLSLQEYFVKERCTPKKIDVFYGSKDIDISDEIKQCLSESDKIIIAPSNPFLSINPILSMKGFGSELKKLKSKTTAVSPIVSGLAIKGPLAEIMKNYSLEVSPTSIAKIYDGLIDSIVIDTSDEKYSQNIIDMGIEPISFNTIMNSDKNKLELARKLIES